MKTLLLMILILMTSSTIAENHDEDFSMAIMDVFSITGRGIVISGRIEAGAIESGDTVCVPLINDEIAAVSVDGLEMFRKLLDRAEAGQMVGVLVNGIDKDDVNKNASLHDDCHLETNEEKVNRNEK